MVHTSQPTYMWQEAHLRVSRLGWATWRPGDKKAPAVREKQAVIETKHVMTHEVSEHQGHAEAVQIS